MAQSHRLVKQIVRFDARRWVKLAINLIHAVRVCINNTCGWLDFREYSPTLETCWSMKRKPGEQLASGKTRSYANPGFFCLGLMTGFQPKGGSKHNIMEIFVCRINFLRKRNNSYSCNKSFSSSFLVEIKKIKRCHNLTNESIEMDCTSYSCDHIFFCNIFLLLMKIFNKNSNRK